MARKRKEIAEMTMNLWIMDDDGDDDNDDDNDNNNDNDDSNMTR